MHTEVVIAGACRTPIGSFQGALQHVSTTELGRIVGEEALRRSRVGKKMVDELICGNVIQAGAGGNVGRQIQAAIGIPWDAPACTVNQLCASSMRALEIGCRNIQLGLSETCLVVGVENMSLAPYLIPQARDGYRMGGGTLEDAMLLDALVCSIENYHMGVTAENVAELYGITREQQDELAFISQQRAASALEKGAFNDEIVPVEIQRKKGTMLFSTDEHPRPGTTPDTLATLRPVFRDNGTVTAGNASGVNDGAAAVVLMSADTARDMGVTPLAAVTATASVGVEPSVMGLGPARAIPRVLQHADRSFEDVDYFEINEAFAAQFLGVKKMLHAECGHELDMEKVNHNGSGISLGHPVGCSGLRVVVSLAYEMRKTGAEIGCASLCAGGGPAMAVILEGRA